MRSCAGLLLPLCLLCVLCCGRCAVYDFDLKTLEVPGDFSNDLKVAADLNAELQHDLMRAQMGSDNEADWPKYEMAASGEKAPRGVATEPEPPEIENFVGTNLFDGNRKTCFSTEDVALLTARRDFEMLIPKDLPQCLLNDEMVSVLMQYFHAGSKVIKTTGDDGAKRITEKAFYDALGGYMRYYIVPVTKFSFYAGKVNLDTVENVVALYEQCKAFLNTNGNGWRTPLTDLLNELKSVQIEPLQVSAAADGDEEPSNCAALDLASVNNDAEDEQMIVSLPKLDAEDCDGQLSNVWLPFKRKRTYNLRASTAAYVVVRFYETVTRCYQFQHMAQDTYDRKFKEWILENVQVHLSDEQFYPGLGAVLRIYENLRRGKKAVQVEEVDAEQVQEDNFADEQDEDVADSMDDTDVAENSADNDDHDATSSVKQYQQRGADADASAAPKKKCKPKCKPKGKPKCKGGKGHHDGDKSFFAKYLSSDKQKLYLKYLGYLLALLLLLLLLILLIAMIIKCAKKAKSKRMHKVPPPLGKKGSPMDKKGPCTDKAAPPGEKKRRFCERFFKRKKKGADEEILIRPESKSVIASKPLQEPSSSTSSLSCRPKKKCIPFSKKCASKSKDTRDYSSSEPDTKRKTTPKPKVVTVDEKSSPKKKKKDDKKSKAKESSPCPSSVSTNSKATTCRGRSSSASPDKGKHKCDPKAATQPKSKSSWETMFDT